MRPRRSSRRSARKGTHVNRSTLSRETYAGAILALLALLVASAGCSGAADNGFKHEAHHDGGTGPLPDGSATGADSPAGDDGSAHDTGVPGVDTGVHDSGPPPPIDTGTITSTDGFGEVRAACIAKINALRATDTAVTLAPYTLVDTTTTNACVDEQATNDEASGIPHNSFNTRAPWCGWPIGGSSMSWGQDECEGYPETVAGIEACLQSMWDESLKPHCLGCVGCTAFGGACPDCDYSGSLGYECGHYVNMSAPYFTEVACGFATGGGTWEVQNFE